MDKFPSARQKAKKNSHIRFVSSKNYFFILIFLIICTESANYSFSRRLEKYR